jgi:hypothetical protein
MQRQRVVPISWVYMCPIPDWNLSVLPWEIARCNGIEVLRSCMSISAPCSSSGCTILVLQVDNARCKGVLRLPCSVLKSVLGTINSHRASGGPSNDTRCKGATWFTSCVLTSSPCSPRSKAAQWANCTAFNRAWCWYPLNDTGYTGVIQLSSNALTRG